MPRFLITSASVPGQFDHLSAEEMGGLIARYLAWGKQLEDEGRLVLSHRLRGGVGKVVRGAEGGGMSVSDGPLANGDEVVGGFWVIEADDMGHALATISTHPHVGAGRLEVREIEALGG